MIELGESHYRRSESTWSESGRPSARVTLRRADDALDVSIDVAIDAACAHPTFVPEGRENPLDNERPEINGDGVQLYIRPADADHVLGWLLVPSAGGNHVRVIPLDPRAAGAPIVARWERTSAGYALAVRIGWSILGAPGADDRVGLDVLVNETTPERERRRGQLVLSGARGEFVYLQGDRHDPTRLLALAFRA